MKFRVLLHIISSLIECKNVRTKGDLKDRAASGFLTQGFTLFVNPEKHMQNFLYLLYFWLNYFKVNFISTSNT